PDDPALKHPNAGKPCVEKMDDRHYRIDFAVENGPVPQVNTFDTDADIVRGVVGEVKRLLDPGLGNVGPSDILIMAPERNDVRMIADALGRETIPAHVVRGLSKKEREASRAVDPRDQNFFQPGKVTVTTIKSAKGHTAHVCHVAFVHNLCVQGV